MRLSRYFLPTSKEIPSEATIPSHQLMLRAGMIAQAGSGIYTWLPLGLRVLKKIEEIVRQEQNRFGAQEVLMPTIQPMDLWKESGRYGCYGEELLAFTDRHNREMCYSPTNEEMITDVFRRYVKSYKDLPISLYQIQWKFRDEIRPRFGVMRGREFLMKDNYSFDLDKESAIRSYQNMYQCYLRTFNRMGLVAIPVKADPGAIGGNMSQEFNIIAETGENELYYHKDIETMRTQSLDSIDLEKLQGLYAASGEMHDPATCPIHEKNLVVKRGIEVGHIFYFGTKYTRSLNALVNGPDGSLVPAEMGSYGIGVSRLVAAAIEANFDDRGIIWPESIAPYKVGLILAKSKDGVAIKLANDIYAQLQENNIEVLYDDRNASTGYKFADMDLIGLPWQVIVGKNAASGYVELKNRKSGELYQIHSEELLGKL